MYTTAIKGNQSHIHPRNITTELYDPILEKDTAEESRHQEEIPFESYMKTRWDLQQWILSHNQRFGK